MESIELGVRPTAGRIEVARLRGDDQAFDCASQRDLLVDAARNDRHPAGTTTFPIDHDVSQMHVVDVGGLVMTIDEAQVPETRRTRVVLLARHSDPKELA